MYSEKKTLKQVYDIVQLAGETREWTEQEQQISSLIEHVGAHMQSTPPSISAEGEEALILRIVNEWGNAKYGMKDFVKWLQEYSQSKTTAVKEVAVAYAEWYKTNNDYNQPLAEASFDNWYKLVYNGRTHLVTVESFAPFIVSGPHLEENPFYTMRKSDLEKVLGIK